MAGDRRRWYKKYMPRVVLRRFDASAASTAEALTVVTAHQGSVIDRSDKTMLIDVARKAAVASIRGKLPGWIVSEQGSAKIPVPDTRLKLRSRG